MTQRWQLTDLQTGAVFNFPRNPSRMTSPNKARNIQSVAVGSGVNAIERNAPPKAWTFSGTVVGGTDYQNLKAALSSTNRQQLTDHLGRVYIVRINKYSISERRMNHAGQYRFDYTADVTTYDRITGGGFGVEPFGAAPFGS